MYKKDDDLIAEIPRRRRSLDHLVDERQQGRRYGYAERFGDLSAVGRSHLLHNRRNPLSINAQ